MQLHSSNSTSQARNILVAFETGNESTLKQQLMLFRTSELAGTTFESERMELLDEITRELEHTSNPFCGGTASVYHDLLKHLASVRPIDRILTSGAKS